MIARSAAFVHPGVFRYCEGAYGVNAIPMTFLVGPDGKIVAKGLRGPSLEKFLADLFKK